MLIRQALHRQPPILVINVNKNTIEAIGTVPHFGVMGLTRAA
jgi:hypothetical protein